MVQIRMHVFERYIGEETLPPQFYMNAPSSSLTKGVMYKVGFQNGVS